jgi:ribosome-associated protein
MKKSAKTVRRPRARTTSRVPADITQAIAAALDKKAENVRLLDLRQSSAFTDFFLLCTGTNVRQVQAIADAIQDALKARGVRPALVEGYKRAEWILIDYFDFIVHIFTPATRDYYALERLWGDAVTIEIPATPAP